MPNSTVSRARNRRPRSSPMAAGTAAISSGRRSSVSASNRRAAPAARSAGLTEPTGIRNTTIGRFHRTRVAGSETGRSACGAGGGAVWLQADGAASSRTAAIRTARQIGDGARTRSLMLTGPVTTTDDRGANGGGRGGAGRAPQAGGRGRRTRSPGSRTYRAGAGPPRRSRERAWARG